MKNASHHLVSAEGSHVRGDRARLLSPVGGDAALETYLPSVPNRPANVRGKLRHLAAG